MLWELFSKENIAFIGVLILLIWRVIDFFIRMKKKRENELEKLAFDMAKTRLNEDYPAYERESLFSYYLFYLDALEHNMQPYSNYSQVMSKFERSFDSRIKRLEEMHKKLEEIEKRLIDKQGITVNDLFDRTVNWRLLIKYFFILLKKLFNKKDKKFKSVY